MRYKVRPGIVRTKICGAYLLIPTRAASEHCPHIRRVGLLLYAAVELIERDEPMEKIYQMYAILTRKGEEGGKALADEQLESLYRDGFLIGSEDE